jgi:large subunit ribosomal protein L4
MQIDVKNIEGQTVETIELKDELFNVPFNNAVVHQAMVMYQLNRRQGTHSTRTRAQVAGGGRKPWAQKHTGRARQGSIRSPQWRHGGVVFGPHPRDHRLEMPKTMRHLALRCVLSDKTRHSRLTLLDSLPFSSPRTKSMIAVLETLGVAKSVLIVTAEPDLNIIRSCHNIPGAWTLPVSLLNAHELLKRDSVIMTVDAARRAEELWAREREKKRQAATKEQL